VNARVCSGSGDEIRRLLEDARYCRAKLALHGPNPRLAGKPAEVSAVILDKQPQNPRHVGTFIREL
jgi:hypothetical protein